MADIVVTVPKTFTHPDVPGEKGLRAWLGEGDPPGAEWSGVEWGFSCGGGTPSVSPGERVYVVCEGRLVGYAPLIRVVTLPGGRVEFVRGGGAVACTLPVPVTGFRGWRYRWWPYEDERPVELPKVATAPRCPECGDLKTECDCAEYELPADMI